MDFQKEHKLNDQKTNKLLKIVLDFLNQYQSSEESPYAKAHKYDGEEEIFVVQEDITKEDASSHLTGERGDHV